MLAFEEKEYLWDKEILDLSSRIQIHKHTEQYHHISRTEGTIDSSMKTDREQVLAGTESLVPFIAEIKPTTKRPLIVTDKGLQKLGVPQVLASVLSKHDLQPAISDHTEPNPSCDDVVNIALAYASNNCDSFIGSTVINFLNSEKVLAVAVP